jgi:hypothetical protein
MKEFGWKKGEKEYLLLNHSKTTIKSSLPFKSGGSTRKLLDL